MKTRPLGKSGMDVAIVGGGTWVLCGVRNQQQLEDNARAGEIELAPADGKRMRRDLDALGEPEKERK